ncbi:MAG: sterol desaturase family protein [Pirellulales bacterium]
MATDVWPSKLVSPTAVERRRAEYVLWGRAKAGGAYNSHLLALGVFALCALVGWMNLWLFVWLSVCTGIAMLIDERPWRRKIDPAAMAGQFGLYLQLLAQAAWDALPFYALAYGLYVCTVPYIAPLNLAVSSFTLLYAFFMIVRVGWLVFYLWRIGFRWNQAGRTFANRKANLRSRSVALRHVLWAYFLGNVGLVVRCGVQVVTLGLFEWIRQRSGMDLQHHPAAAAHLPTIFGVAVVVWFATLWISIKRALLIYYRTHRTLHAHPSLYSSIHSIHHFGVLPTPLDSGTISPAEFWITEMAIPTITIVPNWHFFLIEVCVALIGHLPSHSTGTRLLEFSQHHLNHHRHFNVNLGLTAAEDREFGTLFIASQGHVAAEGAQAPA